MVEIRKLDRDKGDMTATCTLAEAIQEVKEARKNGLLVVDATEEARMLAKVSDIKEDSKLRIYPAVGGG